jgi:hypothetical protein
MIFAQIKDGMIVNEIVLDDMGIVSYFSAGFDLFERVDNMDPRPGIGDPWPPVPPLPDTTIDP